MGDALFGVPIGVDAYELNAKDVSVEISRPLSCSGMLLVVSYIYTLSTVL